MQSRECIASLTRVGAGKDQCSLPSSEGDPPRCDVVLLCVRPDTDPLRDRLSLVLRYVGITARARRLETGLQVLI